MSKMLRRSTRREIGSTFGRFISIFAIVAIGIAFFSGLRISNDVMLENGNIYLEDLNFYDFRVITPLGSDASELEKIAALDNVNIAQGAFLEDALASVGSGDESAYRFHSVTDKINRLSVSAGRLPQGDNECVLDARYFGEDVIGTTVIISSNNTKEISDRFSVKRYTVVGTVTSPIYLNFERGNTSIGSGSISSFIYVLEDAFNSEDHLYDEIYIDCGTDAKIYSEEYDSFIESVEDDLRNDISAVLSERIDFEITKARDKIAEKEKELNESEEIFKTEKADALKALEDAKAELDFSKEQLDTTFEGLDGKIIELTESKAQLEGAIAALRMQLEQVTDEALRVELDYALTKYLYELDELNSSLAMLNILSASKEESYAKYNSALAEYSDNLKSATEKFEETEKEIEEARADIAKAYEETEVAIDWQNLIHTRGYNTGYVCFENDVNIVDAISRVFPIFFFAVAALVCMTTMSRMVDEQRTTIGTFLALGLKKSEVRVKYMWYSGFAAVSGCLFGFAFGTYFIPKIIRIIYTMMYDFKDTKDYIFFPMTFAVSIVVTLICSLGVTALCLNKTFKSVPAELMRPVAPANGGHILLERTGELWEKTPFLDKVTARNLFRYKKRMFMMIFGIGGCAALLLTGFGLKDSICNIVENQYDNVTVFDSSAILSENYTDDETFKSDFSGCLDSIEDYLPVMQFSGDLSNGDISKSATVIVSSENDLSGYFNLEHNGESVEFPSRGYIALDKSLAESLGIKEGSVVTLSDSDYNAYSFTVFTVFENYIGHYALLSSDSFVEKGGVIEYNSILFKHKENTDPMKVAADIAGSGKTLSVTVNQESADRILSMLSNMNYVILIVVVFASALAFVVMFNLININITERKREIATLKVLGFTESESCKYIFRENNILTFIGALLGIPLGFLLHRYCMDQIKIDMVSFEPRIELISYFIAVGMTFIFAILVNLFMRHKITAVDMAGSLKSAE